MFRFRFIVLSTLFLSIFAAAPVLAGEYTNGEYGFSLEYPDGYALESSSDMYFTVRDANGNSVLTGEVEDFKSYPRDLYEGYADPFKEFGTWRAVLRCDADGPDGSAYCPAIKSSRDFQTGGGLRAVELLLIHVQESFGDNPRREESVTGPLYIVDISSEEHTVVLLLGTRPFESMTTKQKEIANSILDSIKLTR